MPHFRILDGVRHPFSHADRSAADAAHVVSPAEPHPQAHNKHDSAASPLGAASSPTQPQPLPPSPSAATSVSTSMAISASRYASPQATESITPPQGTVSGKAGKASDGSTAGERREYREQRMEFALDRLRPNPQHRRPDWNNPRDDAFKALVAAISTAGGVTTPLVCTWAPSGTDLRIIKGHRRWAAARVAGLPTVPVRIMVRADDGQPLANHQLVEIWLRESTATKSPSEQLKALALIHWFQVLPPNDPKRELSQARVAALLYVSPSTVNAAKRLFAQADAVVAAVADKTLPVATALKLSS